MIQKKGGAWDEVITQLVVELLSHRTPPLSVCPNIVSVVQLLMPNTDIIKELPGNRFVRYCRTILAQVSQTLAAYNIAVADTLEQSHTDGTSVRQTAMQNFVVRATKDGVEKKITLSSCILSENESAESIASAILQEFAHARSLITQWLDATIKLYPDRIDLHESIPSVTRLCISRLGLKSFTTTDTCATARKLRRILNTSIQQIAQEKGLSEDEVIVFEADCWQHLRNVWFGGVSSAVSSYLREVLADDLNELPSIYRINLDIDDLFRCIDKEFSKTANYAKGHGSEFFWWMKEFHPDAYLFPVVRALGGTRQDLCVEGAPAVLMNLPYYLQYLHWRISATGGKSDNILQTKLYIMLRSAEVVAMLRVLSILHIAICVPTRWLAGKTHELKEYNFGYYDMGKALDLMETAFESVLNDGSLIYDEEFMMNSIFAEISAEVDPFREYLQYVWVEKSGYTVAGPRDETVLPIDELRAALFYPTRADIMQTNDLCSELGVVCSVAFLKEFRDTTKATHNYLSSIDGQYSLKVISSDMREAGLGKEASNSTSESDFASAKQAVKDYGTLRLDSAAAAGMTRTNDDFGRCHNLLINISKKDTNTMNTKRGTLFDLPKELIRSLFYAARKGAPRLRKRHDDALNILNEAKLDKLKTAQLNNAEKAVEENIVAMNYYEIGVSERRWKSPREATTIYNQLGSESARLKAVKEQIMIRRLGFGWEDCAHQWSSKGHTYSSRELLNFLKSTVLPIEIKRGIPSEPTTNYVATVSINYELGTVSDLQFVDESINTKSSNELAMDAIEERERREQEYETDRQSRLQPSIMPKVDESLVGFSIELCFEYDDDDDSTYYAWCDGVVHSIVNENSRMVMIKWNEKKIQEGDARISRHKLGIRGWNPKTPKPGAWRKFVGDPDA